MSGGRRKYTREFKIDAVKRMIEDEQPQVHVAADLGISPNTLASWKRQYLEDPAYAFPGNGRQKPDDEEVTKLRKELADAKRELSFLKKAAAYFAKNGDSGTK